MNKETFLEELRGRLRILEDQEQEDILEEYAQHIDMKLQKGLSEEEAIRDFGPMKELAAEILEAYHVKPGFEKERPALGTSDLKGIRAVDGGKLFRKAGSFLKTKAMACIHGISRGFRWFGKKCRKAMAWIKKPFSGTQVWPEERAEPAGGETKESSSENHGNMYFEEKTQAACGPIQAEQDGRAPFGKESKVKKVKRVTGNLLKRFFGSMKELSKLFAAFCIWCLRLFWNLSWLFMTLLFGFLTMITLAGLGTGVVLLPQGYPLRGILLICLGGMLCLGAVSCASFSLIIRKKRAEQGAEAPKTQEEEKTEEPEQA